MAREYSSISRIGRTEPFNLQVARGQITGHESLHIFGYNPDVDTLEETVWPLDGILGHPAAPTVMKISSTSANDTAAGTGARTVFIKGLNGTGGYTTETVTLDGQTAVDTVNTYDAIESLVVTSAGSGGKNAGLIYAGTGVVTGGVPAVPYSVISAGENISTVGHWTCPTGYTGYLVFGQFTVGPTVANQFVLGRLTLRQTNGLTLTAAKTALSQGVAAYPFELPIKISPGESIMATAQGSDTNNAVSSYFEILLIQDPT